MPDFTQNVESSSGRITSTLLNHAVEIARQCGAAATFVYCDALDDQALPTTTGDESRVIYVSRNVVEDREQSEHGREFIRVPDVPLNRIGQVKIAIFHALMRGLVRSGDIIVCLSGVPETGTLDALFITQVGREFEMYASPESTSPLPEDIRPEVLERIIDIASELGHEGREGKPVGAIFVVGDTDRVQELSRQLILNPFRGYDKHERSALDESLEETIKELSTVDGAFLVSGDGTIVSCGVYLKTSSLQDCDLPAGLGARHHAAAGITAVTDSIAVTVSESTGSVTVFRNGRIITELEKPRFVSREVMARFTQNDEASS